jgi:hypothetical protein
MSVIAAVCLVVMLERSAAPCAAQPAHKSESF